MESMEKVSLWTETDIKCQFLGPKNLDPESVIMDQFLDPESDKKTSVSESRNWYFLSVSFLDPETDIMDQFLAP